MFLLNFQVAADAVHVGSPEHQNSRTLTFIEVVEQGSPKTNALFE